VIVLETNRLVLRRLDTGDAAFTLRLVNEPSWLQYIGDKGVRSLEEAENYLLTGPIDMNERLGFGMWMVELKPSRKPIGFCGLIKRETLDDVDIGFALLPEYCQKGYAFEAASATLDYAKTQLNLPRIVAITSQDNAVSGKLLEKLGFRYERLLQLSPDDEELKFFVYENSHS